MLHKNIPYRRHQDLKHKQETIRRMKELDGGFRQYNNPFFGGFYSFMIPMWMDKRRVGIASKTPQECSDYCCGNVPRKYGGDSLQEVRNAFTAREESRLKIKNISTKYENVWSWDY